MKRNRVIGQLFGEIFLNLRRNKNQINISSKSVKKKKRKKNCFLKYCNKNNTSKVYKCDLHTKISIKLINKLIKIK